jgi:hypothetical protein
MFDEDMRFIHHSNALPEPALDMRHVSLSIVGILLLASACCYYLENTCLMQDTHESSIALHKAVR